MFRVRTSLLGAANKLRQVVNVHVNAGTQGSASSNPLHVQQQLWIVSRSQATTSTACHAATASPAAWMGRQAQALPAICLQQSLRMFNLAPTEQLSQSATTIRQMSSSSSSGSNSSSSGSPSTSSASSSATSNFAKAGAAEGGKSGAVAGAAQEAKYDSLELTDEKISSITDKIPQRPVGVVEGTSWSLLILAAFGALAFVAYQFVVNFILTPLALQCFYHTIDRLKTDPRITVRLGNADEIRAWGSNSASRVGRQQIPHQIYKDMKGTEHCKLQFYMAGPNGTAQINADMFKDVTGQWTYQYLMVDVYTSASPQPQRLHIVSPRV